MEKEKETLYIPQGIKTRTEMIEGFGRPELIKSIVVIAIASGFDFMYYMASKNMPICALIFMISCATTIMMLSREKVTNTSVVDQIGFMIRYWKSQKYYQYRSLDEWK